MNSYTFYDKIDDILKEDPDAILIYAGHNEFYGAPGIGSSKSPENINNMIIYTPASVRQFINQAFRHLQSGKYDDALAVLHKANKIQETNIANRLIGEILLKKNDRNALGYLKKAYYEFSSDPNFLNTLCYACIYNDDLEYAEKIPGELKQLSPDSERIRNYEMIIAQKRKAGKVK